MTEQELFDQDLQAWDAETKRLQDELDVFLKKFEDIDLLLENAHAEVEYYFRRQNEFTNFNDFKAFLKEEIVFYFGTFGMTRADKKPIRSRLIGIEESYNKILYFGERNPIEERDKPSMPIKLNPLQTLLKILRIRN
ncbi:MAG: hypothetical protein PHN45_01170 [Methylococcales bacterium]|nr:hypothetical protein [Methylococcales bacterium]MDD5753351.1 hypothetical protein [Methylococcales bacterium]